jgi:rhodanese-related sulfurtransferase
MITHITPKEAYEMLKSDPEIILLDVRTPEEYNEYHIENAKLVNVNGADFKEKISKLDKSKKYIVYCRSGVRSDNACRIMNEMGFEQIYNMVGGIMRWKKDINE